MGNIIEYFFLAILSINVLFFVTYAIAGLFYKVPAYNLDAAPKRLALIIPAYKEDRIILDTAAKALLLDYPKESYTIFVAADQLKPETISALQLMDLVVYEMKFEVSTKAKAINEVLNRIKDDGFEGVVILDADNVLQKDFLRISNGLLHKGVKVAQGKRVAKNAENDLAYLDGISEEIAHHIFRKGHRALGLMCSLSGSGTLFQYDYLVSIFNEMNMDTAGEDKLMELIILNRRETVEYIETAVVFDEKVSIDKSFVNQRVRWMSVQLHYVKHYLLKGLYQLFTRANFDYFDKIIQYLLLPKVLLLGILFIFSCGTILFSLSKLWLVLLVSYALALAISIPKEKLNKRFAMALLSLPKAFLLMVTAVTKIRSKRAKQFNVTEKTVKGQQ